MDGVFLFSQVGPVIFAWFREPGAGAAARFPEWLADWRRETEGALVVER